MQMIRLALTKKELKEIYSNVNKGKLVKLDMVNGDILEISLKRDEKLQWHDPNKTKATDKINGDKENAGQK